jgi:ActR/RegA family two-component response regulator
MKPQALIISNNRHSMGYSAGLSAYGFHVEDTRTIEMGRILLKSGSNPHTIIIDMKQHADEVARFVQFVRSELHNQQAYILLIGCENDFALALGADKCLQRPTEVHDIITILQAAL